MTDAQAPQPALPAAGSPQLASRFRRFATMLYEGVLLFGVLFVADYLFDTLTQSRHALVLRDARQAWLFGVLAVYFLWFWTHGGQTLAMKTWHVALVGPDGTAPGWGRSSARYLLIWLPIVAGGFAVAPLPLAAKAGVLTLCAALPFLWSLLDRDGQFLHDRLLGTRLILAKRKSPQLAAHPG